MRGILINSVSDRDPYHLAGSVSDDRDLDPGSAKNLTKTMKKIVLKNTIYTKKKKSWSFNLEKTLQNI